MKKLVPLVAVLLGLSAYVYVFHIRPSREVDPTVRATGTIEATSHAISARLAARILTLPVKEGQRVRLGEVLATLDCADVEARQAQAEAAVAQADVAVLRARAGVEQAQAAERQAVVSQAPLKVGARHAARELRRVRELRPSQVVPEQAVDAAQAREQSAQAQLKAARAGAAVALRAVEVARGAVAMAEAQVEVARRGLQVAEVTLRECRVLAPVAGVVTRRSFEVGETVLPGATLVTVRSEGDPFTWIYVPNEEIGRLRLGAEVRLVADAYPKREFSGLVEHIHEEAEFTPKSVQTKEDRTRLVFGVKVRVRDPKRLLLPGMPVQARLVEREGTPGTPTSPAAPASGAPGGQAG